MSVRRTIKRLISVFKVYWSVYGIKNSRCGSIVFKFCLWVSYHFDAYFSSIRGNDKKAVISWSNFQQSAFAIHCWSCIHSKNFVEKLRTKAFLYFFCFAEMVSKNKFLEYLLFHKKNMNNNEDDSPWFELQQIFSTVDYFFLYMCCIAHWTSVLTAKQQ